MRWSGSPRLPLALALLVALYAALLRLDALVAKYGTVDHPRWAAVLTQRVAPLGARLRPYELGWPREARPYHGGDPINYLRGAREMEGFYQANIREPVFPAMTRAFLWLLGDQDVAVSFASLAGSVLAVLGTYLLAAALMPSIGALAASLLVALDYDMITWSPDGWRDDMFTASVLWTTWALLQLRQSSTVAHALVLGVCAGVACLTRITALSFIAPALLWLVVDVSEGERRARRMMAAASAALAFLIVAPYLTNCARQMGDPLIAINYHTVYYRHGEGLPTEGKMSAAEYIRGKFVRQPVATFDTGFNGIFIQPFITKWSGLIPVLGPARWVLAWAAVAGLMLLPFVPPGRLVLVVLFTSLIPYAFTWNVGGGDAWRFTMHAYPFYLIAACYPFALLFEGAAHLRRARSKRLPAMSRPQPRTVALAAGVVLFAALVPAVYVLMPWLLVREIIARGEDVSIETGARDTVFFRQGWSSPHSDGVTVRVSTADRAVVFIPLPAQAAYDLVLRVDPVVPDAEQKLSVLFNRQFVGRFALTWNPERVGSYRMRLQPHQVRAGRNEIVLIPEKLVPAATAGPRFEWLAADERIGIRLWYVRVLPNPQ